MNSLIILAATFTYLVNHRIDAHSAAADKAYSFADGFIQRFMGKNFRQIDGLSGNSEQLANSYSVLLDMAMKD